MKIIELKPRKITKGLLGSLEKRGLVTTLKFTPGAMKGRGERGKVDLIYRTDRKYGPQKLICVGKKEQKIKMTVHGDREELLLLNTSGISFKPLFLIIGMDKVGDFQKKISNGSLSQKDIIAVELKYNDPGTCVFIINGNVPHCEVTLPGRVQHPIFFVTEPAELSYKVVRTPGYKLEMAVN